jgi:phage terminase small subunit
MEKEKNTKPQLPKLAPQRQDFAEAYLANGFNGAKAAITAGYAENSARQQAYRLLKIDEIQEYIKLRIAEESMPASEALHRLGEHARGDIGDFFTIGEDGLPYINFSAAKEKTRLIKKVRHTTKKDIAGNSTVLVEFELYDAQAALTTILKEAHLTGGEPTERVEVNDGALSDEDRAAKIAALLAKVEARAADSG